MKPRLARRIILSLLMATALYAIFGIGAYSDLSESEAEARAEELENLTLQIDSPLQIFLNNFGLSLIMAIPFAGPLFAGWVSYETGRYVAALALLNNIDTIFLLIIPIITFYGVVEFAGYGGMVMGGTLMAYRILRRRGREELKWYLLTILASGVVILVAALIEYAVIALLQNVIQEAAQYI
jgi:hypothetical protein